MNNQINPLQSTIGEQIRLRRKELMITQPDLADIAGVSVNTLYKIERGQANPTIEVLSKILDAMLWLFKKKKNHFASLPENVNLHHLEDKEYLNPSFHQACRWFQNHAKSVLLAFVNAACLFPVPQPVFCTCTD